MRRGVDDWRTMTMGAWRWTVRPDWADVLLHATGLRIDEWTRQGLTKLIKASRQRTVHRIELPQGAIYVKQHAIPDTRAYLRQWLRPSKARIEAENATALQSRGVPTVVPVAIGEEPHGGSCLITLELAGVQSLQECIASDFSHANAALQVTLRQSLAKALGRFLARLHQAGVEHGDLHPGNVLVRWHGACESELFLIDLHLVELGQALDWSAAHANLLLLNRWFIQKAGRGDRLRFWHAYVDGRDDLPDLRKELAERARELEAKTWQSCIAFWHKRDERCVGNNKYFGTLRGAKGIACRVHDLPETVAREFLRDPEAPFHHAKRVLKHSRSSTVALLEVDVGHGPMACIYKKFAVTKWSDPWIHVARQTPAMRSWINGHRLLECGMPTPRPLLILERWQNGLVRETYLLTAFLPDAADLHAKLKSCAGDFPKKRRLIEAVARLLRELHRRALSHRDLKAANLLVQERDGAFWLQLIDLVGMERWHKLPRSRRVQNLTRLHASSTLHPDVSRTDKLRFLRVYLQWGLKGKMGWKAWWHTIAHATERKLAKNSKRGRPIS